MLAAAILLIAIPCLLFGIYYVPRHDGHGLDFATTILLPTAVICWCIWRLLPPKAGNPS
jgi:hypothetical protein